MFRITNKAALFLICFTRLLQNNFSAYAANELGTLTLQQAYQKALVHAQEPKISETYVAEMESEYQRRLSARYPTLTLYASELIQDVPPGIVTGGNTVSQTFVRRSTPEIYVQLRYIFFSGFREYSALRSTQGRIEQSKLEKSRGEQLLFQDVARIFFSILEKKEQLAITDRILRNIDSQVGQLKRFERLGRSRESERVSAEAEYKRLESDRLLVVSDLETFRLMLSFLTGISPLPELAGDLRLPANMPSLEEARREALSREDIEAARYSLRSSKEDVATVKANFWPQADFRANYYAYRVGFRSEIDWDLGFYLSWPFFEGFRTKAELAQAKNLERRTELQISLLERQVDQELQTIYASLQINMRRLTALKEARDLSEKNHRMQKKEYELGLVTTLDVLSSLRQVIEIQQSEAALQAQVRLQYVSLQVAQGKGTEF